MRAAWLAAHPVISPAEAFASSAELGPPSGSGRDDNQTKNIHTEIKVAVLQSDGAVMKDEQDPVGMLTAAVTKAPILELLKADTALSQGAWLEEQAKKGPLDPGSFFSRSA
jgi:hypothetical protein